MLWARTSTDVSAATDPRLFFLFYFSYFLSIARLKRATEKSPGSGPGRHRPTVVYHRK